MRNEKKRVLKELLEQINPHGHTHKRFQNSFKNEIFFSHNTHTLLQQTTTTTTRITLSLSLQKRNNTTSAECERGVRLEYYMRARMNGSDDVCGENVSSLKDLKTFLFPPLRVRGAGHQKIHLGSQSKFLVSFGKRETQNEREKKKIRDENCEEAFCLCCVLFSRKEERRLYKRRWKKGSGVVAVDALSEDNLPLRFKADSSSLFSSL